MSRPPQGVAFAAASLGLLFVLIGGTLQVAVVNSTGTDGSGPGDGAVIASYALTALLTAGAVLFALGIIVGLWGVYSDREDV